MVFRIKIQYYFKYIIKKHGGETDNLPLKKYVNKIENKSTFRRTTWYYVEVGENIPRLEITEILLVLFNVVNRDYQQDSKVLDNSIPNKLLSQVLAISTKNFIF